MTAHQRSWSGLQLDPLDTLFFRDGRPFDAAARVLSSLPNPQTLAGAIRTALLARCGFRFSEFARRRRELGDVRAALKAVGAADWILDCRFRGPWLALARKGKPLEPLLPVPATMVKDQKGNWLPAEPLEHAEQLGWTDERGLLPLWRSGRPDTKTEPGFLTASGIRAFLKKQPPTEPDFFRHSELYEPDNRTGIALDKETLTSEEGQIYAVRLLALNPTVRKLLPRDPYHGAGVCLYAELLPGAGVPASFEEYLAEPIPLGGEGRHVRPQLVSPCVWPSLQANAKRSLWYLATPALFDPDPAIPPLHEGCVLRAASNQPGIAVSGWDVSRNAPRPTRFAVPAGAVYFVEGAATAEPPFRLPDEVLAEGWGFALQGVW